MTIPRDHDSHRVKRVKIQGALLDPPDGGPPRSVSVYVDEDWEVIYRSPQVHVKCLVPSCPTLLTAKQMSVSGRRFFAVRSGGCSHNQVDLPVGPRDTEKTPVPPAGGGGLESDEHVWFKGRFFAIARALGLEAVIEHQPTHADVFLTDSRIVLEYQRWNSDFVGRARARAIAGGTTIWLFPNPPTGTQRTQKNRAFSDQVFNHGGLFVSVLNKNSRKEQLRPWEDSRLNMNARLYVSGSVVRFDETHQSLQRTRLSLATFLDDVVTGRRVLTDAPVRSASGTISRRRVWALTRDLHRLENMRRTENEQPSTRAAHPTSAESMPTPAPIPAPEGTLPPPTVAAPTFPGENPFVPHPTQEDRPSSRGAPAPLSLWKRFLRRRRDH